MIKIKCRGKRTAVEVVRAALPTLTCTTVGLYSEADLGMNPWEKVSD